MFNIVISCRWVMIYRYWRHIRHILVAVGFLDQGLKLKLKVDWKTNRKFMFQNWRTYLVSCMGILFVSFVFVCGSIEIIFTFCVLVWRVLSNTKNLMYVDMKINRSHRMKYTSYFTVLQVRISHLMSWLFITSVKSPWMAKSYEIGRLVNQAVPEPRKNNSKTTREL